MEVRILEILVALIFFGNKVGLLLERKSSIGWWLGAIASILAVIYFFLLHLLVYAVAEFGLFVLMMYGALVKGENRKVEISIGIITFIVISVLTFLTFSGQLTVFEFYSSVGMLIAAYMLHPKNGMWSMRWGWTILAATHVGATHIGYVKDQQMFADFQLASAFIGIFGALKKN